MKGCRVLESHEVQALLAELSIRDRVWALTQLTFGARISETLTLTFGDVAGRYLNIHSAKGSANATFEIPADYRAALDELRRVYEARARYSPRRLPYS